MKLTGFALAIAVITAPFATAEVVAQPVHSERHVEVSRTVTHRVERHGPRVKRHRQRVCNTRWVNHRKVRRCSYRYR